MLDFRASRLACIRLASVLALQSALLTLCAQSPVIYSFAGSTGDGANPHRAVVINASGALYGTTVYGGSSNDGIVYKLVPGSGTWTEDRATQPHGHHQRRRRTRRGPAAGMTAYTQPVIVYQLHPHAHFRGKDFTYTVVYPDGREQTVLSVPKYKFNWQLAYDLETPLELPAGSKLVVTARYDNSVNNRNNPAADKEVHFLDSGNQSWDEMFTPFIQYAVNASDPAVKPLDIVEVVGCLEENAAGVWRLIDAGDPAVSKTQATSSRTLQADAAKPLGTRRYQLVGARFFDPWGRTAGRVAIKGSLIAGAGESRINVTSLQTVASACVE
jgi:uncharacterized repeat protein (TIGR03803 family)